LFNKKTFKITASLVVICFIVFWFTALNEESNDKYPLIIVDGKTAPRLSFLSFHVEINSDADCMVCHERNKNFILQETNYYSKKIPHVYRENCTACHILEL